MDNRLAFFRIVLFPSFLTKIRHTTTFYEGTIYELLIFLVEYAKKNKVLYVHTLSADYNFFQYQGQNVLFYKKF